MPSPIPDLSESERPSFSSRRKQFWIEILVVLAAFAGTVAAAYYQNRLTLLQHVAVWVFFVLAAAILARKGWIKLFGPVLFYDAIRTGRRSRYIVLRCLYATAILFVLYWTYTSYLTSQPRVWRGPAFPPGVRPVVRQTDAAALAGWFFHNSMKLQFLALLFFTPAYAAGAIAEEKERKTMEFLLATDLHNREIVLSKLVSRLGSLALLVLTGLPILSILQFMGGIDPNLVLAAFALTGVSMASLASVSILVSVYAKKPRTAIVVTYLILLAYLALASWASTLPAATGYLTAAFNTGNLFYVLATLEAEVAKGTDLALVVPRLVRDYALFHLSVAVLCSVWAVVRLRVLALRQSTAIIPRASAQAGFGVRPRVGRLPMIWKEVFIEPGLRLNWIGWLIFSVLFLLSFYLFVGDSGFFDDLLGRRGYRNNVGSNRWLLFVQLCSPTRLYGRPERIPWAERWDLLSQLLNPWVRGMGTTIASLMLVGVAVRASSSISGERDRGTLEGLLTSPLQSHDILFAKWLGSLLGVRRAWFWLGLVWGIGLLTGGLHPAALMLTFVAWLVYASCLAGVGLWFSITCRTTLRATLYTLAVTFGVSLGHWLIWLVLLPFCSPFYARDILALQACITPPAVLYSLSATGNEIGHNLEWEVQTIFAGFGLFLWALAACVIWTVSRARFRRLTSRMPYRRPEFYYRSEHRPAPRTL